MSEDNEALRLAAEPAPEAPEEYFDEELDSPTSAWRIADLGQADWALKRLAALEKEAADNERIAELRIAEIRARTAKLNATALRGADFFRGQLAAYAMSHRTELLGGGKKKTRKLPSGEIAFRSKGGGLSIIDRDALLSWARQQPVESGLLRIKEEPALDEIKRHFKASGEVPDGMQLEEEREEVVVKAVSMGGSDGEH